MDAQQKRTVEIKIRAVGAEAESLADDLRNNRLWEGDLERRMGGIFESLNAARYTANYANNPH